MKLVFVSSTFKDMQYERDMLHTHVIPLLDDKLSKYGESSRFGDLRWGVNTTELSEEESSKKVLQVCLDQIDDCKPYMIVFIGERYGWIPSQELIKNAAILKGIEKVEDDISVTQLEIEYGALLDPDYEGRILFYFRELDKEGMSEQERKIYESESPLHEEKIVKLKEKIQALYPDYVKTYKAKWNSNTKRVENLEPLMDIILEDLSKIFISDIEKYNSLPWQERAIIASEKFLKEKAKVYVNTSTVVTKFREYNQSVFNWKYPNAATSVNYYVGKEGSGKTTRLANHYVSLSKNVNDKNSISIPFVYQIDDYTSTLQNLYYVIIYHLEKALNLKHRKYKCNFDNINTPKESALRYLIQLLKKVFKNNILLNVYVDNVKVNEIYPAFKFLEKNIRNIQYDTFYDIIPINFIVSLNEDVLPPNTPFFDICQSFPLGKLIQEDKLSIIDNMLKFSRKELSNIVINKVLDKKQSNDPFYLSLLLNRLLMLDSTDFQHIRDLGDGMDAINKYMVSIVESLGDDVSSLTKQLINETANRIGFDFVCKFLAITCYSNIWLDLNEYEDIFKFAKWEYNNLNVSLLLNNLKYLFIKRDNGTSIKVENKEVLKGIRQFVIENNYGFVLDVLFKYLKQLPNDNVLKAYSLHFALSTNDGKFIAKYYLDTVKIVKNPKAKHLKKYVVYTEFIVKAIKNKNYEMLIDFFEYLCKENVSISHYYLIQALTIDKLNQNDKIYFDNFVIDLFDRINKLNENAYTLALKLWYRLHISSGLLQLESISSFSNLLLLYNYCNLNKKSLPFELVNEITIELLRVSIKVAGKNDNYETLRMFFDEMLDFKEEYLENVLFKDYQKIMIRGYMARLISNIAYKNCDEEYSEKVEKIYCQSLKKGCKNFKFLNISEIAQETYVIGYFHRANIYIDFDYDKSLTSFIDYCFSQDLFPLHNDIDRCLSLVQFNFVKKQNDIENILFRAYKKTTFLNAYYKEYKYKVFIIISKIFESLNKLDISKIEEFKEVIQGVFFDVINDNNLQFEGGSDEFISSAILNHLEYLAYILHNLYMFNHEELAKDLIINVIDKVKTTLEHDNLYVDLVLYSLWYIYEDADNENEINECVNNIERCLKLINKKDDLLKYYSSLILACYNYVVGDSEYADFAKSITKIYESKIDCDVYVNY